MVWELGSVLVRSCFVVVGWGEGDFFEFLFFYSYGRGDYGRCYTESGRVWIEISCVECLVLSECCWRWRRVGGLCWWC